MGLFLYEAAIAGKDSAGRDIMTQKEYGKRISQMAPPSPILKDCSFAYVIGGRICVLGQILWNYYGSLWLEKNRRLHRRFHDFGGAFCPVYRPEPL